MRVFDGLVCLLCVFLLVCVVGVAYRRFRRAGRLLDAACDKLRVVDTKLRKEEASLHVQLREIAVKQNELRWRITRKLF